MTILGHKSAYEVLVGGESKIIRQLNRGSCDEKRREINYDHLKSQRNNKQS